MHDATPAGCAMAHKLAHDATWFNGRIRVVDLGLRPRHARPFKGLYLKADGKPVLVGLGIEPGEVKWLAKHRLELAAARPEQILKRLHRGLQTHNNDDFSNGGTSNCSAFDSGDSSSDSPDGVDGADSFG